MWGMVGGDLLISSGAISVRAIHRVLVAEYQVGMGGWSILPAICNAVQYQISIAVSCRVGLALLKTAEEELITLPFEQLLAALNSKRFPAFTKPPGQLMKVAMQIKVSRRLALYEAEYRQSLGGETPFPFLSSAEACVDADPPPAHAHLRCESLS